MRPVRTVRLFVCSLFSPCLCYSVRLRVHRLRLGLWRLAPAIWERNGGLSLSHCAVPNNGTCSLTFSLPFSQSRPRSFSGSKAFPFSKSYSISLPFPGFPFSKSRRSPRRRPIFRPHPLPIRQLLLRALTLVFVDPDWVVAPLG